jgi:hypothetical protein
VGGVIGVTESCDDIAGLDGRLSLGWKVASLCVGDGFGVASPEFRRGFSEVWTGVGLG